MIDTRFIKFSTRGNGDMVDLTHEVLDLVFATGIRNGIVVLFVPGATGAVTTIEYEPGLVEDMEVALNRLAPKGADYQHNLRWGDGNGHSHIRASMLGPSLTIPIVEGKLTLGTWQQIVFIDMDVRPRNRNLVVQIMGEGKSTRP